MDREERRDDDMTDEPNEEKTDRRSFLRQAGMIGGGALAAMAGLAASAGAQQDIRLGPEGRMRTIDPTRLPTLRSRGASTEQFAEVFAKLKANRDEIVMSREVAEAMADGIRIRSNADIAVSVTGIAGPDGGTIAKPVGTVFIGMATEKKTQTHRFHFTGTRQQIQEITAKTALDLIRRYLLQQGRKS